MKYLAIAALIGWPAVALADDTTTSALIASRGLAGAAAELQAAEATPDRDMALAAVRFLAGIESAYQARWRIGATSGVLPVPVLNTDLPPNPDPQPMAPDFLNALAADLGAAMQATRETLPDGDAALVLRLTDLWVDVDGNGTRDPDEDLTHLIGMPIPEGVTPEIRFDASDVHWLRAYTHLIGAMTDLTLAFDPEPALARRMALSDALTQQFAQPPGQMARDPRFINEAMAWGPMVDRIAAVVQTLRNQPDPDRIATAAQHLQDMIAANRDFWTAVASETDNDREWIPNDSQQAALGFDLPPDAGAAWLGVLDDAQAVLEGRMLVPFWRFAPGHGIDLKAWIDDPAPVDLIDWFQGSAALPYARPGLTVGDDNWTRFTSMFQGRAGLYMVLFN